MTDFPTKNGYPFDEVTSAFQKSVRRGLMDEAIFWGVELYLSGKAEYAWKRMKIMASEDVGLADRHLPATMHALHEQFAEQARKKDERHAPERLYYIHAILLLVTAPKSRLVDHALLHHFATHEDAKREIPAFAVDKHTRRGRDLGRGLKEFFESGAELANPASIDDPYRDLARQALERGPSVRPHREEPNRSDPLFRDVQDAEDEMG